MNLLGENLKKYRKKEGLTQEDVATYVGKTKNVVSHWEKGINRPDADTIFLLCQLLKITPNQLFNWSDDVQPIKEKQKEFFDIFDSLTPILQDYIIKTAKDLLATQRKMESTKEETADSLESTKEVIPIEERTTEELEAEYKKRISTHVPKTGFTAMNTMQGTDENKNKAI